MMSSNDVIFETKVTVKEGTPYLPSLTSRLFVTENEIRIIDRNWTYIIPLCNVYDCITKPLPIKTYMFPAILIENLHNFLIIDYIDERNKRKLLYMGFIRYFWTKTNVKEAMRFDEMVEKYRLRDKFRKDTMPENEK